jgi:hypothetical protein
VLGKFFKVGHIKTKGRQIEAIVGPKQEGHLMSAGGPRA